MMMSSGGAGFVTRIPMRWPCGLHCASILFTSVSEMDMLGYLARMASTADRTAAECFCPPLLASSYAYSASIPRSSIHAGCMPFLGGLPRFVAICPPIKELDLPAQESGNGYVVSLVRGSYARSVRAACCAAPHEQIG